MIPRDVFLNPYLFVRQQLAQAQAALASRDPPGGGGGVGAPQPNPLQFRPRPDIELPPVDAPALFDDGTLNLMAAAGDVRTQ